MKATRNNPHAPLPIELSSAQVDRFWANVGAVTESGCWEWGGPRTAGGYGQVSRGRNKTKLYAHRVSYTLCEGDIPAGMVIDHLCRNRGCVNPAHLEPVTVRENNLRGVGPSAKFARQTHCIHGHEFTPENTSITSKGSRHCRECARISDKKRPSGWQRQRDAAERKTA